MPDAVAAIGDSLDRWTSPDRATFEAYRTTNATRAGRKSSAPDRSCRVAPTGPAQGAWASLAAVVIAVDELLGREPLAKHLGADRQGLILADEVDVGLGRDLVFHVQAPERGVDVES